MERNEPPATATHRPRATARALAAALFCLAAGVATAQTVKETLDVTRQAVEMRRVDMRDVFPNLNAMAPAPRGQTMYKVPARFETASPPADRLEVTLTEGEGTVVLTLRYGDRRLPLTLTR